MGYNWEERKQKNYKPKRVLVPKNWTYIQRYQEVNLKLQQLGYTRIPIVERENQKN